MSNATLKDPDYLARLDRAYEAMEKLRFLGDLCAAWDVQSVEVSHDNLSAMALLLDEIIDAVEAVVRSTEDG